MHSVLLDGADLTRQPFDLTELDWNTEIWVAYQDTDEDVARMAETLWEDNGLDVSETFAVDLLPLLGESFTFIFHRVTVVLIACTW